MNHLDLFSGIGGFSLAASWVWGDEHNIVSFCEIDPFCQKVLNKHWPDIPIQPDIKEYKHDGTNVDLLTGGYPCQAFSTACHGHNTAEDLSPWMHIVIRKVRPRYIIAENVEEKTINGFKKWLEINNYRAFTYNISANEHGADHERLRWFAIAHPNDNGKLQGRINEKASMLQSIQHPAWGWKNFARTIRVSDGLPNRLHRLKSLGNAIVPQCVQPIMQAIKDINENIFV